MLRLLESKGKLGNFRLPASSFIAEEDTFGDNPISRLHEFLQCRGIEKPIFDDDKYGTQFEVRCSIFQLKMETSARSLTVTVYLDFTFFITRCIQETGKEGGCKGYDK